jgi:hypothetical protein
MTEDIPYSHRFVANSDSGKRMARAYLGHLHRMDGLWFCYSLVLWIFWLLLRTGMNSIDGNWTAKDVWAFVFALVATLTVAVFTATIHYFQMVRRSRLRWFSGAILESGFGEDEMAYRDVVESSRIAYAGITSVTARGDFVFMEQHGVPLVCVYPRELLPDEAIDRILLA